MIFHLEIPPFSIYFISEPMLNHAQKKFRSIWRRIGVGGRPVERKRFTATAVPFTMKNSHCKFIFFSPFATYKSLIIIIFLLCHSELLEGDERKRIIIAVWQTHYVDAR